MTNTISTTTTTTDTDIDTLMAFLGAPLESADAVLDQFASLPGAIRRGEGTTQFVFVPGHRQNKVLLAAHADTVWDEHYNSSRSSPHNSSPQQKLINQGGIIRNENGGLGADDRAGCALVWLLRDMGHSILITHGEEQGRQGSSWLMDEHEDIADDINLRHQFAIQLDRRNGKDFKCYEVGTDAFRSYIRKTTGYSEPDRNSFTDIVTLCRTICGVNLSVGYRNEHTADEYLVIDEWQHTLNLCRQWLSADVLPQFLLEEEAVET